VSDLFLLPSAEESFGLAALDAMAASAVTLLSDPVQHRAMAEAARFRVTDAFCADKIVPLYEAAYGRLL